MCTYPDVLLYILLFLRCRVARILKRFVTSHERIDAPVSAVHCLPACLCVSPQRPVARPPHGNASLSLTPLLNAQERLLRGAVGSLQRAQYGQILLASVECQEELHCHSLLRSLVLAVLCLQEFQTRTLTTDELLAEHLHAASAHHPSNIMSQETAHALHYHYHQGLYNIQRSSWVERFVISHRILFHLEGSQRSALFQEQFRAFLTVLTLAESQRRQDVAYIELICSTGCAFANCATSYPSLWVFHADSPLPASIARLLPSVHVTCGVYT